MGLADKGFRAWFAHLGDLKSLLAVEGLDFVTTTKPITKYQFVTNNGDTLGFK